MKRVAGLVLAGFCALTYVGVSHASQTNTGCGLGSILFKDKDGLLSQVCAATSNGVFGNQTFGITFGTSNCAKYSSFTSNEKLNKFVHENMDNLAVDISKGSGEYLSTLAVLLDTPVEQRAELYLRLQANFSRIYASEGVTHLDVLDNIEAILHQPS